MAEACPTIGRNVRRIRAARGIAAAELARRCRLSRATLTALEAGRGNPTLDTLSTLATELGVPLAELMSDHHPAGFVVVPADVGATLRRGPMRARLVHRMALDQALIELWDLSVPRRRQAGAPHALNVSEHVFVRSGRLRVESGGERVDLGEGDFVSFAADGAHSYEGLGGRSEALACITYPSSAAAARTVAAESGPA
jgi:transcriptional regulator with XRE-family HTH domain